MRRLARIAGIAALALVTATGGAGAQGRGVPNAIQGFSQNRDQPVQIEAASLEVRDKDKVATFAGNVKVVQGDTIMRCRSLIVVYEGNTAPGATMRSAKPGPGGKSQISRLEARGSVVVTQKDQTATGDLGLFDMKTNTVTLSGNVVVSQGQNIMRGERLVVDLTTGVSKVEGSHGPVRMLIQQQPSGGNGAPGMPKLGGQRPMSPN